MKIVVASSSIALQFDSRVQFSICPKVDQRRIAKCTPFRCGTGTVRWCGASEDSERVSTCPCAQDVSSASREPDIDHTTVMIRHAVRKQNGAGCSAGSGRSRDGRNVFNVGTFICEDSCRMTYRVKAHGHSLGTAHSLCASFPGRVMTNVPV